MKSLWSRLALLAAALIWGSSFVVMKNSTEVFPTFTLLGLRFTIGCGALCLIFFKKLKSVKKSTLVHGGVIGLFLFTAYSVQTIGLIHTTPGKNAFLTAVYCVLTPFVYWLTSRRRPDRYNWAAAILCLAGIGLVSLEGDLTMGLGDGLTLLGGLFYAFHLVAVSRWSQEDDPVILTILQFAMAALCAWVLSFFTEAFPQNARLDNWLGLIYLALFATAGALLLQNVGQKHTPAAPAAILLSLESVFGVIFSILFYDEAVTLKLLCGFALIFVSVIVSETKLKFFKK